MTKFILFLYFIKDFLVENAPQIVISAIGVSIKYLMGQTFKYKEAIGLFLFTIICSIFILPKFITDHKTLSGVSLILGYLSQHILNYLPKLFNVFTTNLEKKINDGNKSSK